MEQSRFLIGAYILQPYARQERHIRSIAECGVDFICGMTEDAEALALFSRYGIGCYLEGVFPGWWGGHGERAGKMEQENPLDRYTGALQAYRCHPAVWGLCMGDEPAAQDFVFCDRIIALMREQTPDLTPYLNLYPVYGAVAENSPAQRQRELGTEDYRTYIRRYVETVHTGYICFDHYMYSGTPEEAYENFQIVAQACRESGRKMWTVLQVNSSRPDRWISENQLRHQAYTALAYGSRRLIWACWTGGWWYHQVLDEKGRKTRQYRRLHRVNREVRALGEKAQEYTHVCTRRITAQAADAGEGAFSAVQCAGGEKVLAGFLEKRGESGRFAMLLAEASDPYGRRRKPVQVKFQYTGGEGGLLAVLSGQERPLFPENGWYTLNLPPCGGALVFPAERP